jgi:hypothetical protein
MSRARTVSAALIIAVAAGCDGDPATAPRGVAPNALVTGTLVVTNTSDAGPGTLRQAIADAADGATVQFDPGVAGQTISLTSGPLLVTTALTIEGPASAGMTISGGNASRVLAVSSPQEATVRNVTITGGNAVTGGGGIVVGDGAKLTLEHSTVSGNTAAQVGGGISNEGTLRLVNSTVSGNHAGFGGGIAVSGSLGSSVVAVATVINSTIAANNATDGGGIYVGEGGVLVLENSLVGNTATTNANCRIDGAISLQGTNLSHDVSCGAAGPGMIVDEPLLVPLFANGGPTKTHALPKDSPAVGAATNCTVTDDQRYVARPQGLACDIGAFEFDGYLEVTISVNASAAVSPTTGVAIVTGSMTCSAPGPITLSVGLSQTQKTGRLTTVAHASSQTVVNCTGTKAWSISLAPPTGAFKTGAGSVIASAANPDPGAASGLASTSVKLYWGRK